MARHPPSLTSMTDSLDQNLKVVSQNVSERKKPTKVLLIDTNIKVRFYH